MIDVDSHLQSALPDPADWLPTELRRAAVLCPIVAHEGQDHLLFMLRPQDGRPHAGQIAFPGGMHEAGESPLQTAMRECFEEVGAPAANITPLGELVPRRSSSRIHVHCIVARVAPFEVRMQPEEVDRVIFVPLAELRDTSRWQDRLPPRRPAGAVLHKSPHFEFGDDLIWGLTGRFVRDLVAELEGNG